MKIGKIAVVALIALMVSGCGSEENVQSDAETVSNEIVGETDMVTEETDKESNLLDNDTTETDIDNNGLSFPLGQAINSDAFTGTAYIEPMINYDDIYNFPQTNNIIFEPGARSSWHTHGGMIILGTGGVGYYQEEGKPAQIIREGDVIEIPEGVRHWHGATPDSWFSQIVIYDSNYVGTDEHSSEPVTNEIYENLETEEYAGRTVTEDNQFMLQRANESVTMDTFNGPIYLSSIIGADNVAEAPDLHYVVFEPGVKHWHGGSANTSFAHIAVNTNPEMTGLEWFDRITDEEYTQLETEK